MLNSNPVKYISNYKYFLNNQYYILSELKKNIKSHIRIKSNILNKENLYDALNNKGEILIIQSDDFIGNNNIIGENEKGESIEILFEDLINMIRTKEINYKVIILCFLNSYSLKKYFDENNILYKYLIHFENINFSRNNIMKQYNKICIKFIIDFIKQSANNDDIKEVFEVSKNEFNKNIKKIINEFEENVILTVNVRNDLKIKYHKEIEERKIYLYNPLPKLDNIDFEGNDFQDYSLDVYNLIRDINYENNKIFYCDKTNKSL